ncbi:MAG TPA: efflux RND transporter permease subunit, partial [Kiloniellales bacterium]
AKAQRGQGEITISFAIGQDLGRGLLEVLNRLNRVARYPDDAEEPVISTVGGGSRAVAWFILKPDNGNTRDIQSYQDYVEEVVQTRFERVPGVALSEVRGGREREVRITFDPYRAASLGIELPQAAALAGRNEDVSGGEANVGKRRYTLRFTGAFDAGQLGELVLDWRDGRPVMLRDVADIEVRMVDRKSFVITKGERAMAVNAHREIGVNVLDVMRGLQQAAAELRDGPLKRANLSFEQVYDETIYIYRSIEMLTSNLGAGIVLAIGVLWWFLRKFRATLMVAIAIPAAILSAFLVLDMTGRTLNVISLAGLAFAVGMTLDAAIVVLENFVRLRERGEPGEQAALKGPTQVWGALLASTATTVAIFLPVVFLKDEAGQLFADLALTIATAVVASLMVSLTVIPTAARAWLSKANLEDKHAGWWRAMTRLIISLTDTPARRALWILVLVTVPIAASWTLLPKADYLPEGNRNLAFAFVIPPPGVNIDHIEKEMGNVIAARIAPYMSGEKEPKVKQYFFVAFPRGVFMGVRADDDKRIRELVPVLNQIVGGFPDTLAFAKQLSLFGGFGEGRTIDINVQGRNLETIIKAAQVAYGATAAAMPEAKVRPFPDLELAEPELRLIPDEHRIKQAGWNRETMAQVTRALGEGLFVGDYFDGEERLDIIVRVQPWYTPEELAVIPLATPVAGVLPVG